MTTSGSGCTKSKGKLQRINKPNRFANAGVCKILVGNKCDMEENRRVSFEEGMELAKHYEIPFLETSAKNSINVENSFITMSNEIKRTIQTKASAPAQAEKKGIKFGQGISHAHNLDSEETSDG